MLSGSSDSQVSYVIDDHAHVLLINQVLLTKVESIASEPLRHMEEEATPRLVANGVWSDIRSHVFFQT